MFNVATPNFIFMLIVLCKYVLGMIVKKCFQMPLKKHVSYRYISHKGQITGSPGPPKASLLLADGSDY